MFSNKCSTLHSNSVFCYDKFSEPWYFEAIKDSEVIGKFKPMLITNKETFAKTTTRRKEDLHICIPEKQNNLNAPIPKHFMLTQ